MKIFQNGDELISMQLSKSWLCVASAAQVKGFDLYKLGENSLNYKSIFPIYCILFMTKGCQKSNLIQKPTP